jgi:putative FmdB family regulatory protein
MPTFDFTCKKCGTIFEFARPFGSKAVPACPKCKSKRTEKLLSPPSVQFKGTGFYKTDSTKESAPKKTEKPKVDAPKAAEPTTTPKESGSKTE